MSNFLIVIIIALLAGVFGTGLGGIVGVLFKTTNPNVLKTVLAFAAGCMLGISLLNLIPESFALGGIIPVLVGLLTGVLIYLLVQTIIGASDKKNSNYNNTASSKKRFISIGLTIFLAIFLHDLPEGVAIGAGFTAGIGVLMAIVMFVHNVPEGLSIAVPLRAAGVKKAKVILITMLAGLPTLLGATIGYFIGFNTVFMSYALSFAAGLMIMVVFNELLLEVYFNNDKASVAFLFLLIGIVVIFTVSALV